MSSVLLSKMSPDHMFSPDTDREIERIQREQDLIEQRDRLPLESNRTPPEVNFPEMDVPPAEGTDFETKVFDGLLMALERRLA